MSNIQSTTEGVTAEVMSDEFLATFFIPEISKHYGQFYVVMWHGANKDDNYYTGHVSMNDWTAPEPDEDTQVTDVQIHETYEQAVFAFSSRYQRLYTAYLNTQDTDDLED